LNSEKIWKMQKKSKLNSEKIWKIWKKINWIVKWFDKYGRKESRIVKKIWKIQKKSKFNSEKIWKIQKKTVKR
jgi:hypothetical protein